jgi:hypothetical protein
MSSIKNHWFDTQEAKKEEWIRDRIEDEEMDEYSDEWQELSDEYDDIEEESRNQAELEEELHWLETRTYTDEYVKFNKEISKLKEMLDKIVTFEFKDTICKMSYAHSVTLLESYLGDTLKLLILKYPKFLDNAIKNVDGLKKARFSLTQIHESPNGIISFVLPEISRYLYHNIPKVINIYEAVLGCKLKLDISAVDSITNIRHDIVHRDAKTQDGNVLNIDDFVAKKAVTDIEVFVKELQKKIYEIINL